MSLTGLRYMRSDESATVEAVTIASKPCQAKPVTPYSPVSNEPTESFKPFPKLPSEIRNLIWSLSLPGQRVIEIEWNHTSGRFFTSSPTPTTLSVCTEARAEAMRTLRVFSFPNDVFIYDEIEDEDEDYEAMKSDEYVTTPSRKPFATFIDWSQDIAYLHKRHMDSSLSSNNWINIVNDDVPYRNLVALLESVEIFRTNIRRLAVDPLSLCDCRGMNSFAALIANLKKVEEIIWVMHNDTCCYRELPPREHAKVTGFTWCNLGGIPSEWFEALPNLGSLEDYEFDNYEVEASHFKQLVLDWIWNNPDCSPKPRQELEATLLNIEFRPRYVVRDFAGK
ncbi:hypothetical protein L207DRAFT_638569 [Hyaloscypha variabilis F]|uniref:2EXR domain-containing protein n=1 Tax=Hyaloscypha variabilis (strain UAMH 11265 / GT02V1 / F) TaxID=1149755 RepID=A0A2J6R665_HYAVF|nr:hypothetical protein L207DRAFT_638569 [Hyaloscypha variabilis F]